MLLFLTLQVWIKGGYRKNPPGFRMAGSVEGMMRVFFTDDGKKDAKFYNFRPKDDRKVHKEHLR